VLFLLRRLSPFSFLSGEVKDNLSRELSRCSFFWIAPIGWIVPLIERPLVFGLRSDTAKPCDSPYFRWQKELPRSFPCGELPLSPPSPGDPARPYRDFPLVLDRSADFFFRQASRTAIGPLPPKINRRFSFRGVITTPQFSSTAPARRRRIPPLERCRSPMRFSPPPPEHIVITFPLFLIAQGGGSR